MKIAGRRKQSPRVYVTLKDALTKEVRGITIDDASIGQVLKKLEEVFNPSKPSRRRGSRRTAASVSPLPTTAKAQAGV